MFINIHIENQGVNFWRGKLAELQNPQKISFAHNTVLIYKLLTRI